MNSVYLKLCLSIGVHKFSDATLPRNTWRIRCEFNRLQWIEMHLERDPAFEERLKDYSIPFYFKTLERIRLSKNRRYPYY